MHPSDAARELEAMLDAERGRRYPPGWDGSTAAICGRRRVEALELALSLLEQAERRELRGERAAR